MEAKDCGARLPWKDTDLLQTHRIFTVEKNILDYFSTMLSICCALVTDLSVSKLTSVSASCEVRFISQRIDKKNGLIKNFQTEGKFTGNSENEIY